MNPELTPELFDVIGSNLEPAFLLVEAKLVSRWWKSRAAIWFAGSAVQHELGLSLWCHGFDKSGVMRVWKPHLICAGQAPGRLRFVSDKTFARPTVDPLSDCTVFCLSLDLWGGKLSSIQPGPLLISYKKVSGSLLAETLDQSGYSVSYNLERLQGPSGLSSLLLSFEHFTLPLSCLTKPTFL